MAALLILAGAPTRGEALIGPLGKAFEKVKKGVGSVAKKIEGAGKSAVSAVSNLGHRAFETVTKSIGKVGGPLGGALNKLVSGFGNGVAAKLKEIGGKGLKLGSGLLSGLKDSFHKAFDKAREGALGAIRKATNGLVSNLNGFGKQFKEAIDRGFARLKDLAQKGEKYVKGGMKKVFDEIQAGAKKAIEGLKNVAKLGLAMLKKLAKGAWKLIKKFNCSTLMDKLFDLGKVNKTKVEDAGALWYAGKCGQEFTKGLLCSIPDMIIEAVRLVGDTAIYAWKHKAICIGGGALVGLMTAGPTPAAVVPVLICGAGFMLADKIPKAVRCVKKLLTSSGGGGMNVKQILATVVEFGCNIAGSLVVDIIIAILTGGAAGPPLIAKKIGSIAAKLTAKLPAEFVKMATKMAKVKDVLSKVKLGMSTLNKASECKF
jgi:hypothetical protein